MRLQERLDEMQLQTVSSPRLDGMPRCGSQGDAMASMLIQKQEQEERVRRAQKQLRKAQKDARRITARLPIRVRMFYEAYYILGYKQTDACGFARVCTRTGTNYMQMVEGVREKRGE